MLRYSVPSAADADVAWALVAEPSRWHEWSPHVRGAWGLGDGEVESSALGAARLFGVLPVPARIDIVEKSAERRHWVWKVGLVKIDHEVRTDPDGCTIVLTCHAPAALEPVIRFTYWPIVKLLVDRLATVAEDALPRTPAYA
ncbi:MAG: SRPBCC family protein [Solirubrobacteraceae bacterium]|nr:SRPBCC family protein [Solirubrobacteraceae bacterium]